MSKLQKKFFGYFLVLGIAPVVVVSIISVLAIYFLHIRDVRLIEENLLNQKSAEISKFFENIVSEVQVIVGYENYAQPKLSEQKFLVEGITKVNSNIKEASFVCAVSKDCKVGMETAKSVVGIGRKKSSNRTNDPEFLNAVKGKIYFSDIKFEGNSPMIMISAPVKNKNNQIIGVLIVNSELAPIQEIIKNSVLGKTGYVFLTDSKNKIIANSSYIDNFSPNKAKDVISTWKNIPNFDWKIIAEWPKKEVYEIIGDVAIKTILIILVVVIIVFLLSYFVAGGILNPIKELIKGAKIVGGGNLNYKIDVKSDDELQELANQFNRMTSGLNEIETLTRALQKEQELSSIKSKLLTTISHQLNTPISRIGWVGEVIEKNIDDKEALKEAVKIIKESHRNISTIVQDALFLTEIGASKYWVKEKIKIDEIISRILEKFKNRIVEKNIKVKFDKDGNCEIEANKITMEKLFETLLDNAIIYNKQDGEIIIKIQNLKSKIQNTESGEKDGFLISIKDTGIGIPKDEQVYIFREIIRAKNAVVGENVGTGMGLFIAKMVVKGHNGKIWFESKENEETTFYVQLPFA